MNLSTTQKLFKSFFLIVFFTYNAAGQLKKEVVKDTIKKEIKDSVAHKSYFKFSSSYLTNYVYNGRKDTITTPYITPSIGYFNKKGFTTSFSGYYLNATNEHRFDFYTLDMNYKHKFNDKLSGSLVASRTFYNKSSNSLSSNIKGDLGANVDYDFGFIELFVESSAVFSQKTDFDLYFELEHEFSVINGDDEFKITPTFGLNFSTLNYYEGYLNKKIGRKKLTNVDAVVYVDNNKFTLMNYELSLPLSYETNQFVFFVTPTYAIPKNTIDTTTITTTTLNNGVHQVVSKKSTSTIERDLKQSFYVEFGVFYKLNL